MGQTDGTLHSMIIEENLLDAYTYTHTRLGLSYCADHLFSPIRIYSKIFVIYVDSYGVSLKRLFVWLECIFNLMLLIAC